MAKKKPATKKKPAKTGRKTIYTPELGEKIADLMASGKSARAICDQHKADKDFPSFGCLMRWATDPQHPFYDQYARGKASRAEGYVDLLNDAATDLLSENPKRDPQAAKVAIDTIKWTACKFVPKVYGDKVQIEHTHEVGELPDGEIMGIIGMIRGRIGPNERGSGTRALPSRIEEPGDHADD